MRVRHTETRAQFSEPSVNFYRTIALSFLVITVGLLATVIFITSRKVSVTILAKEDTRDVNLTVPVSVHEQEKSNGSIEGTVSSTVINYNEKYFPTGSKTIEGVATGEVTIFNKTSEIQVLVKTTRLLSEGNVLFRLSDKVSVPANGQVAASVYADKPGQESNLGPSKFTIPGLSTDKQTVIYAESTTAMNNGVRKVGVLTDEDVKAAKKDLEQKLQEKYVIIDSDENIGRVISVSNINPLLDKKVGEEVDGFNLSGTSTIVIISYDKKSLNQIINNAVTSKIDTTLEKALAVVSDPKVSVADFDSSAQSAHLAVNQSVLVTLDANAEKLSPQYFMGKNKGEIERYVFELNHVVGVEVKFSPSWISKAPSVPDKIKIIVKDVK